MGVSWHPFLDEFYDVYLGIAYVSSVWIERRLSKQKRQIGGLSCMNSGRVNFRMYKYNDMAPPCTKAEWKGILKELQRDTSSGALPKLLTGCLIVTVSSLPLRANMRRKY